MRGISAFDRFGGFARVRLLVADFYERVLESEQLVGYFDGIDIRRLIDHQTKFVAAMMGGPASFTNEQMLRAHQRLGVTDTDFDEMASLFRDTLEDFALDPDEVTRLHAHLLSMREFVVATGALPLHGARP